MVDIWSVLISALAFASLSLMSARSCLSMSRYFSQDSQTLRTLPRWSLSIT